MNSFCSNNYNIMKQPNITNNKVYKYTSIYDGSENKAYINRLFSRCVKNAILYNKLNLNDFCCMILDHTNHATSQALLDTKVLEPDNILVIETDDKVVLSHNSFGIPCHHGTVKEFASDNYDKIYSQPESNYREYLYPGIYLDFCGNISVVSSALDAISKCNFVDFSIIAITFSTRTGRSVIKFEELLSNFKHKLNKILNKKNFTISKTTEMYYSGKKLNINHIKGKMFTIIFKICKICMIL
jgi:hypothetical protein